MPVSPEKAEGPVQVIQFLGLTIDMVLMVIKVLDDKRADISQDTDKDGPQEEGYQLRSTIPCGKIEFSL